MYVCAACDDLPTSSGYQHRGVWGRLVLDKEGKPSELTDSDTGRTHSNRHLNYVVPSPVGGDSTSAQTEESRGGFS